jgi:hypothetical protein
VCATKFSSAQYRRNLPKYCFHCDPSAFAFGHSEFSDASRPLAAAFMFGSALLHQRLKTVRVTRLLRRQFKAQVGIGNLKLATH